MDASWLDVLDAAYQMDGPHDAWLSNVMSSAMPLLSRDLGTVGVLYDACQAVTSLSATKRFRKARPA